MNEIKVLPWMWYSQLQAMAFWLNHTQAIIMNYISASLACWWWADETNIEWRIYYRCHSSKFLHDMPTLKIWKTTLNKNVNDLVKLWLIDKKVVRNTEPYFRVEEKWLYWWGNQNPITYPSKIWWQYNIINQIKKEKNWRSIAEKLLGELSSYLEEKKPKENIYNLENIKWGKLVLLIRDKLLAVKNWETKLKIESKKEINQGYIDEIVQTIITLGDRYEKLERDMKWNPSMESLARVITEMEKLFDWYELKWKTIKDLKAATRNWFQKNFSN